MKQPTIKVSDYKTIIKLHKLLNVLPSELEEQLKEAHSRYLNLFKPESESDSETTKEDRLYYPEMIHVDKEGLPITSSDDFVFFVDENYGLPKIVARIYFSDDFHDCFTYSVISDKDAPKSEHILKKHFDDNQEVYQLLVYAFEHNLLNINHLLDLLIVSNTPPIDDSKDKVFKPINSEDFESNIFGAESMLKFYPNILTEGVRCRKIKDLWFIINPQTNKPYSDSSFFSEEEMVFLKEVN